MPGEPRPVDGDHEGRGRALAPLRHRDFRWLLAGRSTSYLGNAVAPIALAFAVLDLTGSVSDLGWVVGARSVTNVALLLFGGVVADRLPRALVLSASCAAAALTQGAVAALVLTGTATIPWLIVLGAVNGAVSAMAFPAAAALTPQTVPETLVRPANALLRLSINSALVGGAAVGGILVAAVGPGWGIAVDAAMFAASGAVFSRIRVADVRAAPGEHAEPSTWRQLREGWGEFTRRRWVWVVVLQFMVVNASLTGGIAVLGPAVADDTFGRRAWGFVLAAQTVGMVIGGLVALRWQPRHALRYGVALTALTAVPLLALAHAPSALVLGVTMLADGIAIEQFGVAWDVSLAAERAGRPPGPRLLLRRGRLVRRHPGRTDAGRADRRPGRRGGHLDRSGRARRPRHRGGAGQRQRPKAATVRRAVDGGRRQRAARAGTAPAGRAGPPAGRRLTPTPSRACTQATKCTLGGGGTCTEATKCTLGGGGTCTEATKCTLGVGQPSSDVWRESSSSTSSWSVPLVARALPPHGPGLPSRLGEAAARLGHDRHERRHVVQRELGLAATSTAPSATSMYDQKSP